MAGTYVAEAWPEDRRKMGAGYLQSGYYFGFFAAAALNATIGATYGWRAMFLCGLFPVIVSLVTLLKVKEPERWETLHNTVQGRVSPLLKIFEPQYRSRTLVMSTLLTVAIIGLWAGSVYEPAAAITLAKEPATPQRTPFASRPTARPSYRSARCSAASPCRSSPSGSAAGPPWRCSFPAC